MCYYLMIVLELRLGDMDKQNSDVAQPGESRVLIRLRSWVRIPPSGLTTLINT